MMRLIAAAVLALCACPSVVEPEVRYCGKWLVNVRDCPGTKTKCNLIDHYPINTRVTLTGTTRVIKAHTWYLVGLEDGVEGWIRGDLLRHTAVTAEQARKQLQVKAAALSNARSDKSARSDYNSAMADWTELNGQTAAAASMMLNSMMDGRVDDVRELLKKPRPRARICGWTSSKNTLAAYQGLVASKKTLPDGELLAWRSWPMENFRTGFLALHHKSDKTYRQLYGVFDRGAPTTSEICVYRRVDMELNGTERRALERTRAELRIRP
jgi:hypothetical protein